MVRPLALAAVLASHLVGQPVLPAAQSRLASRAATASDAIWIDVPFVKQAKGGCGSASVAMVMQYWGQSPEGADAGRIHEETYTADAGGSYAASLKRYLQDHGFRAFAFRGAWEDLRSQLSKGRPLIVCLRPSKKNAPRHYVVVAGVAEDFVYLNDPADRKLRKQDRASFEERWSAAGNWMLLALPRQTP